MIEVAFNFAYTPILGISILTYIQAINFVLIITTFVMGIGASRGKVNPINHETVAFFAIGITIANLILWFLLLL